MPREHGAWAMLVVPVLVGAILTTPTWRNALLLVTWLVAYLAFHATGLWLRASRRPRYLPPVRAYGVTLVVLGAVLLGSAPGLVRWAPAYGVLLTTSLVCSRRRADRSWLNDAVTVGAAVLMSVVSAGLGRDGTPSATTLTGTWVPPGADDAAAWAVAAVLAGYFLGTVPYVKTLLRSRGSRVVLAVSVGWHAALVLAACAVLVSRLADDRSGGTGAAVALVVVAACLLARAVLVPRVRPWPSPKAIGFGEIAATLAVTAATLTTPTLLP